MKSIKNIYKIGHGPSSSHTMGPAFAASMFKDKYQDADFFKVILYGSLSKTGKGHGTDRALMKTFAPVNSEVEFSNVELIDKIHPNTLDLYAYKNNNQIGYARVYSIGGGEIKFADCDITLTNNDIYAENNFEEIKKYCLANKIDLVKYIEINEGTEIWNYLIGIWKVMEDAIKEGLVKEGTLPGGLGVVRKAKKLHDSIGFSTHPEIIECQKVCSYAYAVSEQNADNGIIVTAPTCGSCGVLPAVLYYFKNKRSLSDLEIAHALGVAGLFGELAKNNASISGAECGCQAEIGVACSMAAAALSEIFGYNINQIEYAAEIALEHHLGLTCDPINGLVQIPCIERNAVAAMRAINSCNLAYFLFESRKISYDMVLKTMYNTGLDINNRYRETSEGGLSETYKSFC